MFTPIARVLHFSLLVAGMAFAATGSRACDTPVYRYAMYRWQPAPFEIYYFHHGDDQGSAVEQAVRSRSRDPRRPANLVFASVDLGQEDVLTTLPHDVQQSWSERPSDMQTGFLVCSPLGRHLYTGPLKPADVDLLCGSPGRSHVAGLLAEALPCVFVMLDGPDDGENERIAQTIQGVVDEVGRGDVPLYITEGDEDEAGVVLGFVRVDRTDPREAWFVRSLLAVEADLQQHDKPMVFAVFGRGRAIFTGLGDGVTADHLVADIQYVTGQCSCQVKEQNPGADLLMQYDWEAVAETMRDRYGSEEGNETVFGPELLFPDLVIPSGDDSTGEAGSETAAAGDSPRATDEGGEGGGGEPGTEGEPAGSADRTESTDSGLDSDGPSGQATEGADAAPGDDRSTPGDPGIEAADEPSDGDPGVGDSPPADDAENPVRREGADDAEATWSETGERSNAERVAAAPTPSDSMTDGTVAEAEDESPPAWRPLVYVGLGIGLSVVALFAATLLILRPR